MTSNTVGSPIASIFQQWTAQQVSQQKQSEDDGAENTFSTKCSSSLSSYSILLQTSYTLQHRIQAAEPVDNPHLYRRAGVPTPAERAIRDSVGASETAWLLRLIELAAHQQQSAQHSNVVKVIYISTQSRTSGNTLIECLPQELKTRIQVVDLASENPWGWDTISVDDNNCDDTGHCEETAVEDSGASATTTDTINMKDLATVYQHLKDQIMIDNKPTNRRTSPPRILIWQSLTPLLAVHGFDRVLRLLMGSYPVPCLQVWPVNIQSLTPHQHRQLEDASNALLCMQGGEMTMIRQGVRERGKIIRGQIPFRLHVVDLEGNDNFCVDEEDEFLSIRCQFRRYRIVEGEEEVVDTMNSSEIPKTEDVPSMNGRGGTTMMDAPPSGTDRVPTGTGTTSSSSSQSGLGRPRVQLRMEEDNDVGVDRLSSGRNRQDNNVVVSKQDSTAQHNIHQPRIYMQDDDPEFDDLDEEDPDDDLDI
jgi:hypothetical protein